MSRHISPRLYLAAVLVCAGAAGSMLAAGRSSSVMADAATRLVASLTADQRQQAAFAFEGDERLHWHFIPTEMFPRKGLLIRSMTEPQRKLAPDLMKSGLSQRGYLTASSIMDLETVLKALEAAERAAGPQPPRGQVLERDPESISSRSRHAVSEGHVGVAGGGPSRLAALHGRERDAGRLVTDLLRQQPGGSARGAEERSADSRRGRGRGARCCNRWTPRSAPRRSSTPRLPATW
jgi:hypothetical protein